MECHGSERIFACGDQNTGCMSRLTAGGFETFASLLKLYWNVCSVAVLQISWCFFGSKTFEFLDGKIATIDTSATQQLNGPIYPNFQ